MTTGRSVRHTSKETRKTKTKTTTTRVKAKEGKTIAKTINRIQQRQPQRQSMMILGKTSVGLILAATVVGNSFFLPPQVCVERGTPFFTQGETVCRSETTDKPLVTFLSFVSFHLSQI